MNPEAVKAQFDSLRAQLDALEIMVLSAAPAPEPEPAGCPHPEDKRVDAATMGNARRFLCKACGQFVNPGAVTND